MVRTKVFVGNLSFQTQEAELAAEFGNAGKVISANIITRGPRSLGYGFVEMDSEEDAKKAVEQMNKKEIGGRQINVEVAKPQEERPPRPPKTENNGENAPTKRRPRKRVPRTTTGGEGQSQQQPRREFKTKSVPTNSESSKDEEDKGRSRRRRRAPGQRRPISEENREESKTTLFVANLPFSLNDEGFAKVLTDLGLKLKSAHVVTKKNGRSKGYGFVEFDSHDDQQKALVALNKKEVEGRELSVKVALTEIKREGKEEESKENKPVYAEKKSAAPSSEKKTTAPVADKKVAAPSEKKTTPSAEKKSVAPPVTEKKSTAPPAEKKTTPVAEKKVAAPVSEKKSTPPAEKKAAAPVSEKKAATPEKKEEKK